MEDSFNTLDKFLRDQIARRRKEVLNEMNLDRNFDSGRRDIFSILVKANEDINEKYPLDDDELVCMVL